jgi:16S rRNA (guanine527-N7)-methyltransferase
MRERAVVLEALAVSRETADRLDRLVALLTQWQRVKNLVAPATLAEVWDRHILDSAQLMPLLGSAKTVADLGSGAGFPGLVLAILGRDQTGFRVDLVESNQRKAAFLQEAVRQTGAAAAVRPQRIEDYAATAPQVDWVTARALAPLAELLVLAEPLLKTGAQALFLKGRHAEEELTEARRSWRIDAELIASRTDTAGRIVHVRRAERS